MKLKVNGCTSCLICMMPRLQYCVTVNSTGGIHSHLNHYSNVFTSHTTTSCNTVATYMGTNTMAGRNFSCKKEKVQAFTYALNTVKLGKAGDFASWTRNCWSWISCKMITNLWNATYAAKIFQSDMQIPYPNHWIHLPRLIWSLKY